MSAKSQKDIQAATASEPLTLEQEYAMQRSWQEDADKLTFVICLPTAAQSTPDDHTAEIASMLGDVNLFISLHEEVDGSRSLVGEVELMIALREYQHKGYGRETMLCFLQYLANHETNILQLFLKANSLQSMPPKFDYLTSKIGETNEASLRLFESLDFRKTTPTPNYFGEFELRGPTLSTESIVKLTNEYGVKGYQECHYGSPTNAFTTALRS